MARLEFKQVSIDEANALMPKRNNWKAIVHSLEDGPLVLEERLSDTFITHCRNVARWEGIPISIRLSKTHTIIALRGQI